ncbi:MAG TPA: diguanylate cyclase, partial [Bacillota bacterium]|nr:diguanylate cyclase [Bacillota bacterium]
MRNIKKTIAPLFRKRSTWVIILIALLFAAAITAVFVHEKQKLNAEFTSTITSSLNIHTKNNAARIEQEIEDAERALKMAGSIFRRSKSDGIESFLKQRNDANPVYTVEYITMEKMRADAPLFFAQTDQENALSRLAQGETVVGDISYDDESGKYFLTVVLPFQEGDAVTGVLYTRFKTGVLLLERSESEAYQDVQSDLITADGDVVLNASASGQGGNLFDALHEYHLAQTEIDRIADVVRSPEMDNATFLRNGEIYYAAAVQLKYNGWNIVSFVRGPDVLLHSAGIFREMVHTSVIAILITAAVAMVVFLQLRFSRKRLEEEQRRNYALAQRFQAMFEQHSALKVVVDSATREVMDVNPALLSFFGYTREEMLGRHMGEFNLLPAEIVAEKYRSELPKDAMFSAAPFRLESGEIRLLDVYASYIMEGEQRLLYAILFDVTDREHYRDELLQEKELLRTTLQSIGDGVVTTDNLGIITSMNSVAERLTGWDNEMAVGKAFSEVFVLENEDTGQTVENPIQKVLETGLVIGLANHTELVNRQGGRTPIADSAAPIQKSKDEQTFGVVMVFRDVSNEKEHSKEIEFLSYHDSLTGLYNRRYIEEIMIRTGKDEYLPVSVIMADVNGLKITNDVFGHKAGDALLKSVADLMRKYCGESGLVARWGGDEFVILMPETRLESAEAVIQQMKDTRIEIEGSSLSLSLSLGCACKSTAQTDIQAALQHAEENMYQQKLLDGKSYRNAIISTLLATLYEKSNETEEHSKRIEKYCHAIGRELQLSSKEMDELSLLALLHDIGKVGIHPNILKKTGTLTSEEWDEMKRHPEIGYRIAQATPELAVVADLILSHHERWDGEGYPRRLKGEEIPLAC